MNLLLTGAPRIGKTTALEGTLDRLRDRGLRVGGITAPEIRSQGTRVGFRIEDVMTGESAVMAHVDFEDGPSVGKYTVDVATVDEFSRRSFDRVLGTVDVIAIDEIAPMEVQSRGFIEGVSSALDSDTPVLGVVHGSSDGFFGRVKDRPDVEVITVTTDNRDDLPRRLEQAVAAGELPDDW